MKSNDIQLLLESKVPLFFVNTHEETRFEELLAELAKTNKMKFRSWSYCARTDDDIPTPFLISQQTEGSDIFSELDYIAKEKNPTIFLLKGVGRRIKNNDPEPQLIRRIKEFVTNPHYYYKLSDGPKYKPIFILDNNISIPSELEKESVVIDYDLLDKEQIEDVLLQWEKMHKDNSGIIFEDKNNISQNLRGLTESEIVNILSYIDAKYSHDNNVNILDIVKEQKRQMIKKSEFLEFVSDEVDVKDVGGMDALKQWLHTRKLAYSKEAEEYKLPRPKGVLLVGLPGGGKSLIAKAISNIWKVPLVKWDVSKLFNSFVGASERNARSALKTIEALGNCVLWIDEIEKGLAGVHSSTYTDGGTTARIFGLILTWLQENQSGAFLVATSNNIKQLPPELLRKGRFNEIFFVPLPSNDERMEIFDIHLRKKGRNPKKFNLEVLSNISNGYVGSEIEESIISAMFEAFADNKREVNTDDILIALKQMVPLSKTMGDQLKDLNSFVDDGKVRFASTINEKSVLSRNVGFKSE